jgi:hypothetical protein
MKDNGVKEASRLRGLDETLVDSAYSRSSATDGTSTSSKCVGSPVASEIFTPLHRDIPSSCSLNLVQPTSPLHLRCSP